jgi:Ca2+-binding RTX toxin-like protein
MSFFFKFLSCWILIAQLLVALISLPVNSATLTGTDGDDTLLGYSGDDQFTSGEGYDVLVGYSGDDTFLIDGIGNKTIDGGSGEDTLRVDFDGLSDLSNYKLGKNEGLISITNDDLQIEFSGIEKFIFNSASYFFSPNTPINSGDGGLSNALFSIDENAIYSYGYTTWYAQNICQGNHNLNMNCNDELSYFGSDYSENINLNTHAHNGKFMIILGSGNDSLVYAKLKNQDSVDMGDGDDFVSLVIGEDVNGNQTIADAMFEKLDGGDGVDTLSFETSSNISLVIELSTAGAINFENLVGTPADDVIHGDLQSNILIGNGGDDIIFGFEGDDILQADDEVQAEMDGGTSYIVTSDELYGGYGDDILYGSGGDNILSGGIGTDIIYSGAGYDSIYIFPGQGDADIEKSDIITDFEDGKDIFELQGISYSDLTIIQGENDYLNDVIVQYAGEYLLVIQNTQLSSINYLDFVTAEPADSDDDGVPDHLDAFPLDSTETADIDGDGIGDNSDTDADNDGLPNDFETANGLNPVDASDAQSDSDMDGLTALEEYNLGTSPTNDDTDRDTLPDGWEVENGRDPLIADYRVELGYADYLHGCLLHDSGVECWGNNDNGQTEVPTLSNPTGLSLGFLTSCAIDDSGVVCWGSNAAGDYYNTIPSLNNPSTLSVGLYHSCAIDDTGVVCWGYNNYGQTEVPTLSNPTGISTSDYHSCAIDDSGVVCWGKYSHSVSLVNPRQISGDCALDDSGVVCWGSNQYGQTDVPPLINPSYISANSDHVCALDDTGVVCWGYNQFNQTNVPPLNNPYDVSVGHNNICALDDSGVVCWGEIDFDDAIPEFIKDPDNDGFLSHNNVDAFPLDPNEWLDTDLDGVGNNADIDDDNDGFADTYEIANNLDPLVANFDIDNDGIANDIDSDIDGDGMLNNMDAFPLDSNEQIDSDSDGVGDNADADNDNDGIINTLDLFPLNSFESSDSDGDGVGDNADFFPNSAEYYLDSDLDQMPDAWEIKYGLNPTDASDAFLDQDNDGLTALEEYEAGTIPLKILDIDANGSFDALTDGLIILRYAFGLRGQALI